jgi:hypothetical protein
MDFLISSFFEENRKSMMVQAGPQLEYFKTIKQVVEQKFAEDISDNMKSEYTKPAHSDLMDFINKNISDLEIDVLGKERYTYIIKINQDNLDGHTQENDIIFETLEQVHEFIAELVMSDASKELYSFDKTPYTVPTPAIIDEILTKNKFGNFTNILLCGDKNSKWINFDAISVRMNY